jgi:multiple sugar transport system substrate-binding protein
MPALIISVLAASCSQTAVKEADVQPAAVKQEPVTLKFFLSVSLKEVFQKYAEPSLKAKLPQITVEFVDTSAKLEELVTSGSVPDVVMPNGNLFPYLEMGLPIDLTELVKKHGFDVSKIEPSLVGSIKQYGKNGELYALPSDRGARILLYNKSIFDKFAVPYPKDGMTWDDTLALARKLTREVDGTYYRGLDVPYNVFTSQLLTPFFDANGKASLFTPGWQQTAEYWKRYNEIPDLAKSKAGRDGFTKDQTLAMLITHPSFLIRVPVDGLSWDMVESPTFSNKLTADGLGSMFSITTSSKYKDEAFKVIQLWFSDEVQTAISRDAALIPSVTSAEVLKPYASGLASAKGLNLSTNFPQKQAVKVVERDGDIATPIVNKAFAEIATGQRDINTILREAEELINKGTADKAKR